MLVGDAEWDDASAVRRGLHRDRYRPRLCSATRSAAPPARGLLDLQETKILDRIDKCISEEIQEINQLEIEATNESLGDLPYIPGKSLLGQGAESVAAYYGAELLEHILAGLDYLDLVIDMGKEVWKDKEFNKKLNDAKQRECKCMRDGTNQ